MTTYNTGNPIPSADARDRFDNSQTFDEVINSSADSALDRFGRPRVTLNKFDKIVNNAEAEIGVTISKAQTAVNNAKDLGISNINASVVAVDQVAEAAKAEMLQTAAELGDDLNNKRYGTYEEMVADPQTRDAVVAVVDGDSNVQLDGWYSWDLGALTWVYFENQPARGDVVDSISTDVSLLAASGWTKQQNNRALLSGFDDAGGLVELDAELNLVGGPEVIAQLANETKAGIAAYEESPKRALLGSYDDIQDDYVQDSDGNIVEGPTVISALLGIIDTLPPAVATIEGGRAPVYIDTGALKTITDAGEKTVASITPNQFVGGAQWRGLAVIAGSNRPSVGSKTAVAVAQPSDGYPAVVPSADKLLIVVPSYGQSNSVGAQAYAPPASMADSPWPENLLMFDLAVGVPDVRMGLPAGGAAAGSEEVLSGANLVGFKPLISVQSAAQSNRGATALEGIGFTVQAMAAEYLGFQPSVLMFAAGYGSRPYRDLKKGTIPYTNFLTALGRAKVLADQQGYVMYVPFIALVHGEGDSTNLSYAADLVQLQADMQADVQAVTGQAGTVPMACSQASTFFSTEVNGVLDTYKVSKSSALHSLSAPYYPYEMYAGDELHLGNRGLYLGEKMARTILRDSKLWGASGKGALKPVSVSFDGANTLDIALEVPFPPLVRDQINPIVNTPAPSNWGFEVQDGTGAVVAISSVQIIGNSIRIVTAATPAGGAQRAIRYAMTGYAGTQNGGGVRVKGYQARGQVRDSEATPSIVDGSPLYNWLVHFSENF